MNPTSGSLYSPSGSLSSPQWFTFQGTVVHFPVPSCSLSRTQWFIFQGPVVHLPGPSGSLSRASGSLSMAQWSTFQGQWFTFHGPVVHFPVPRIYLTMVLVKNWKYFTYRSNPWAIFKQALPFKQSLNTTLQFRPIGENFSSKKYKFQKIA